MSEPISTTPMPRDSNGPAQRRRVISSTTRMYFTTIGAIVALFVIGQILSPGFASFKSIINVIALAVPLAAAAIGQNLVIISGNGGLDLSIDAMIPMGAYMGSIFAGFYSGDVVTAIIGLVLLGALVGSINGLSIRFAGVPPFVMTMGMALVVQGFVIAYTGGQMSGHTPSLVLSLAIGTIWGPLRWIILFGIALTIVVELVLKRTRYGRQLYLLGSNQVAALMAGMNVNRVILATYIIAGVTSTLSGFILLGTVGSATFSMGAGYNLLTIAAVVIGGTQLSGGKGSFLGTVLGAVLMIVLASALTSFNVSQGLRTAIQGAILLAIVIGYTRGPKLRQ